MTISMSIRTRIFKADAPEADAPLARIDAVLYAIKSATRTVELL